MGIEVAVDAHATVGEGPVWDERDQSLLWVDITAGLVHRFDPATGEDRCTAVGQHVGAAALRERGGLVVAVRGGFAAFDFESGRLEHIADTEADRPTNRMNDGKVDDAGRFWAGSMAYSEVGKEGSLYRLDPDGSVTRVLGEVGISNGLGWSPDSTVMYYIDSLAAAVDAFDFDLATGQLSNRRSLVKVRPEQGTPDGMTVDEEGCLWVAFWGGGCVRRYAPDGALDATVELPVRQVTSCTFGGGDLRDLYITSAARGLSADDLERQPNAGAVFRHRPGVRGTPARMYAG